MKSKNQNDNLVKVTLGLVALLGVIFICLSFSEVYVKADCDLVLDYGINKSLPCWMDSIDSEHCPLPSKVQCSIEASAPLITLIGGI